MYDKMPTGTKSADDKGWIMNFLLEESRGFTKEEAIMHRNLLKKRSKPLFTGYRPQFYVRTTNDDGTINLPE